MRNLILLMLLFACGTTQAAEWVSLGKTSDGALEILVDVASVRIADDVRRVWTRRLLTPHADKGVGSYAKSRVTQYLSRAAVNCRDETYRFESTAMFFDYGTSWYWLEDAFPKRWERVTADTAESAMMQFVCTWKPR